MAFTRCVGEPTCSCTKLTATATQVFKHLYGDDLFPNANRQLVYLGASASAEFFADLALCPFEVCIAKPIGFV